jgi:predicted dehydrogenase
MAQPIRVGLLGFSAKGTWAVVSHLPYFLSDEGKKKYTITALAGSSLESAEEAIKVYKLPPTTAAHGSPESLAADANVDLVVISVKTPNHYAMAKPMLEAGKSVFVEWSFGNRLGESEELAALARAKGVRTMIGTQGRQALAVQRAKQLIQDGAIGRIFYTQFEATASLWGPTIDGTVTYHLPDENGATMLQVYGGHMMESFSYVLGTLVSGAAAFIHIGSDLTSSPTDTSSLWKIQGEKGRITLRNPNAGVIHVCDAELVLEQVAEDGSVKVTETIPCPSFAFDTTVGRAWDKFATGEAGVDYPTFDTGVIRKRFLDAVERSAATGQRTSYQTTL